MTETEIRALLEGAYAQTPTLPGFYIKYDDFSRLLNRLVAEHGAAPIDIEKILQELYPGTKVEPCFQIQGTGEICKVIRIAPNKLKCIKELCKKLESAIKAIAIDSNGWLNLASVGQKVGKEDWRKMGFKSVRQATECLLKNSVEFRAGDPAKHEAPVQIRYKKAADKSNAPATTAAAVASPEKPTPTPLKKIDLTSLKPVTGKNSESPSKKTSEKLYWQGAGINEALNQFAYFPRTQQEQNISGWDSAINSLSDIALKERWYYNEEDKQKKPILRSYLAYTFERLQYEDSIERVKAKAEGRQPKLKILQNERNAIFNTGLVNNIYDPIYAFFRRNNNENKQPWIFMAFDTANSYRQNIITNFAYRPGRAEYFTNPTDLYYDLNAQRPTLNWAHIINDNIERLPAGFVKRGATPGFAFADNPDTFPVAQRKAYYKRLAEAIYKDDEWIQILTTRFNNALNIALSRVAWNYKTAIPVYFATEHNLSLLLPLALEKSDVIDVALVCEHKLNKEQGVNNYVGRTIFTLQMAYNNARLITRPDSDWLMADMCETH